VAALPVWLAACVGLSGCSQNVVVETDFPDPLVEKAPLNVGVFYTDALRNYSYEEDVPNDVAWSFSMGAANIRMFDAAMGAMFARVTPVTAPGGTGAPFDELDVVIEPALDAFEFSLPRQSRSDQYGVWIRYNLRVYTPDGTLQTTWPVSAYGQSDARTFGSEHSMEAAVVQAMRDAIASMVIGFTSTPTIRAILFPETAAGPDGDNVPDIEALPAVGVDAETALLGEPGAGTPLVSDTEPGPDATDPGESPGEAE
jgi:hypothetical protein